jgi:hypothetical protein
MSTRLTQPQGLDLPRRRERQAGALLSFAEAVEAGVIEHGVRSLVEALNVEGLCRTIASCEGHGRPRRFLREARLDRMPFVLFFAHEWLSQAIAVELDHGHGRTKELHYCWRLQAYYYPPDFERLAWHIEPNDVCLPRLWDRSLIDRDLHALANIVGRAVGTGA